MQCNVAVRTKNPYETNVCFDVLHTVLIFAASTPHSVVDDPVSHRNKCKDISLHNL